MAADVIADLQRLLPEAGRESTRLLLQAELSRQQSSLPPRPSSSAAPPLPVSREVVQSTEVAYSKISRYAWDQSKKFVKVYVTLPGVEKVPDENISLQVQDGTALTFQVLGLPPPAAPPNARLACHRLYGMVDESQCTWVRKADSMVLLKLRKATEDEEWGSLDDSARVAAKRKEDKLEANKGKSTQQLLSEMYADADEDGKASLAAAWEAGRSKREGRE
jgi:calcyclin binding protein